MKFFLTRIRRLLMTVMDMQHLNRVVQALEEKRGQIRCRRCGGKKFRLEKRYEQEEHEQ